MRSMLVSMDGQRFGRWLVVKRHGRTKTAYWLCRCDCGNEKVVNGSSLRKGASQSCGCLNSELAAARSTTHGGARRIVPRPPEYSVWCGMKSRCRNPNDESNFKHYGARGIEVCDRWLGHDGFTNFLVDMGPRPSAKHTIDRIDCDGNYEPANCRWATTFQQNRNYGRNKVYVIDGVSRCLKEWCEAHEKPYGRTYQRIKRGWSLQRALAAAQDNRGGHMTIQYRARRHVE